MIPRLPRTVRVAVGVPAVFLLLAGCASGERASPVSTARADDVVVHCTAGRTGAALVEFVRAFNAGDYRRLNALFAGPTWFRWYSSGAPGERFTPKAQKRSTLIDYFHARHREEDRFRLLSFRFNGNSNGYGNFQWKLRRSAADFRHRAWFRTEAKGAALCGSTKVRFIVMSVGAPQA